MAYHKTRKPRKSRKTRKAGAPELRATTVIQKKMHSPKKSKKRSNKDVVMDSVDDISKLLSGIQALRVTKPKKVANKKATTKKARSELRRRNVFEKHRKKVEPISLSDLFSKVKL